MKGNRCQSSSSETDLGSPPSAQISEEDLFGWPFGTLSRKILADQIEAALAVRNLDSESATRMDFIPICRSNIMGMVPR